MSDRDLRHLILYCCADVVIQGKQPHLFKQVLKKKNGNNYFLSPIQAPVLCFGLHLEILLLLVFSLSLSLSQFDLDFWLAGKGPVR